MRARVRPHPCHGGQAQLPLRAVCSAVSDCCDDPCRTCHPLPDLSSGPMWKGGSQPIIQAAEQSKGGGFGVGVVRKANLMLKAEWPPVAGLSAPKAKGVEPATVLASVCPSV